MPPERQRPKLGERAAAIAALLALAAAAILTIAGVATHIAAAAAALASLLVCVTACWYAVSRRGTRRVTAVTAAAVGVSGFVASLVFAALAVWRDVLVAVLAIGSVGAARVALHRTVRAQHRARAHPGAAVQPAHPVLIMNLESGGGKAERFHLEEACRTRGIEPVILRPGDDLRQLAEDAAARGADAIGMAGGDGSQALVATVAAENGIPFVCIPAGTRNHFALDLGLDRSDVVGALDAFTDRAETKADLACVNGRVFVNNASLGVYAKVVRSPEYRAAKLKTAAALLPDLLGPDAEPLDLRFTGPDGHRYPSAHMIMVSNNPYQLDRLGGWGTREHLDGGELGIVAVRIEDAVGARRFAALETTGQPHRFPGWLEWCAPRFQVGSGGPVEIGIDGEAVVLDPPLMFETRPGALRVLLPARVVRIPPAGRAVHLLRRSTVVQLGRVAVGNRPG